MKLYVLDCGRIEVPTNYLTPERDVGTPVTIPYPMFVIDHPKGLVLFDTGPVIEHWPDLMLKGVETTPEQRADRQLVRLGYKPEEVKYVVISHMHMDHCGGMNLFPDATFIIRKQESGLRGGRKPSKAAIYTTTTRTPEATGISSPATTRRWISSSTGLWSV